MTAEVRRSIVLAAAGLLGGFALVVALFGTGELLKRNAAVNPSAETPAASDKPSAGTETGDRTGQKPPAEPPHAALGASSQGVTGPADRRTGSREEDGAPSFDIVRVEPDGASVVAGRAAPNARIDLLRDGQPFATVQADAAGQFALTPPDLPPGTSEIALRATGADGTPLPGRESVTVVVAARRDAKPLIALSAPDKPTRVLSQPDAPDMSGKPATALAETSGKSAPVSGGSETAEARKGTGKDAGRGATERAIRIVSVDAQENGRLDVTSQAAPGSSLRLYLNDTMVASGQSGSDGRTAFTIGRGVKPGAYRIRVDAVDAKGKVRNRAEVAFAYPETSPPTRLAGAGPADTSGQIGAGTSSGTPVLTAAKPPGVPGRMAGGGSPEGAMPPGAKNQEATRPAATTGTAHPAPTLAGTPPRAGEPAATAPERPASRGTASLAASGAVAPAPGTDRQASAALAPSLPDTGSLTANGTVYVPEISTARITRGDSLWQISRRTYGRGNRYTVIYDANQDQIRDPNRIYPGQMFVLPQDEPSPGKPTAKQGSDRRT